MESEGDPRVHFVMNLLLSLTFASFVVWGLSFIDVIAFEWTTIGWLTLLVMLLTHIIVVR